jgi:transcriptional regulator with XRE-family HTH domain
MQVDEKNAFCLDERHDGHNIQRIRVYMGIKQESLAKELNISRSQLSLIEQQNEIDDELLANISNILGVTSELIKNFDLEKAIYNINNYKDATINGNYKDTTVNEGGNLIAHQEINPLEKVVELYERLLKSEREKLELFLKQNTKV